MEKLKKIGLGSMFALAWVSVVTFFIYTLGAVFYCPLLPRVVAIVLAVLFLLGGIYLFFKIKPKRNWLPVAATAIIAVYLIGLLERPSVDRDWAPDQQQSPRVTFAGNDSNHVTIENYRNNHYRTESDYDARFGTFEFELDQITHVWFMMQRFISVEGIAHTFLTFEIQTDEGPKFFSVSVEIRRERGESFSPIRGMYRVYELIYVIGDERDLIGVRTVMRPNDRVYMYPTNANAKQAQDLFVEIAERANKLREQPEFYNSFLNNCSNNLVSHAYKLTPEPVNWMDPFALIPGYNDRFALVNGLIGERGESFEELSTRSRIDELAREVGITEDFSLAIRGRDVDAEKKSD